MYPFYVTILLLVFVALHEISHSFIAKRHKIKVRKIVLYPIGGVSEIDKIPDNPRVECRMAVAGPLASLGIGVILLVLSQLILQEVPVLLSAGSLVYELAAVNFLRGGFNLVPAFQMNGGRVLRALLAKKMKFADATKYAAFIGRILRRGMAIFGIIYNFWFSIIGVFIYVGATEEAEQTIVSTTIARIRMRDVMFSEVASIKPENSLTEALEIMFKARYHDALVVRWSFSGNCNLE